MVFSTVMKKNQVFNQQYFMFSTPTRPSHHFSRTDLCSNFFHNFLFHSHKFCKCFYSTTDLWLTVFERKYLQLLIIAITGHSHKLWKLYQTCSLFHPWDKPSHGVNSSASHEFYPNHCVLLMILPAQSSDDI